MSSSVTGRFSSGSMTRSSAATTWSRLGSILRLSLAIRQQRVDLPRQVGDLLGQLLVLPRQARVRLEQRRKPVRLGLDRGHPLASVLLFALAVLLEQVRGDLVA